MERSKFYMPAEYAPHEGTLLIWPVRPGSWPHGGKAAQQAFCRIMEALLPHEKVWLLAGRDHLEEARAAVPAGVEVLELESDDAWARDVGPTFLIDGQGGRMGVDWQFNAWGGDVDGLYAHWEKDDAVASQFCRLLGDPVLNAHPFVLEGGSIHSDGEGTILTTESCLLSAGRNPEMTKAEIEAKLLETLGAEKVLWLPRGIYNDETNEHVDNICCFVGPAQVALAWTDDENDPQYPLSRACETALQGATDAKARPFTIHRLPIPKTPITVREEDLTGYIFEEGEDVRDVGERLAASYVNFYIANGGIILPAFGDPADEQAAEVLRRCFPGREIVPIPARDILTGGGNIHCITSQIPRRGK